MIAQHMLTSKPFGALVKGRSATGVMKPRLSAWRSCATSEKKSGEGMKESAEQVRESTGRGMEQAKEAAARQGSAVRSAAEDVRRTVSQGAEAVRESDFAKNLEREDLMSMRGPLPELVNARLAMLGFVACMAAEFFSHQTLVEQIKAAPVAIAATFAVVVLASIIPVMRGSNVNLDPAREKPLRVGFNVANELINGRTAMFGFAVVVLYEVLLHRPTFS